jgi:hypothetical protein
MAADEENGSKVEGKTPNPRHSGTSLKNIREDIRILQSY